jgi:hypothetical protein
LGEATHCPVDLSDKAIAAALNRVLDEIAETARATSSTGRVSRRLIGRVLAVRLGIPVWTGQTVAKRWARGARRARCRRGHGPTSPSTVDHRLASQA